MHIADSLCHIAETNRTLEGNYTPIKMLKKRKRNVHHNDKITKSQVPFPWEEQGTNNGN